MSFFNISKTIRDKPKQWVKSTRKGIYTPCASTFPREKRNKRLNRKNSQNGHFNEIFEMFRFFLKKRQFSHISYFDPLVILSFIIKLSKI